jgi:glutamyl-tRNA synthetase
MLRVDDLDRERVQTAFVEDVFLRLDELDIRYDFGPRSLQELNNQFSQTLRLSRYLEIVEQMHKLGLIYACSCSRKSVSEQLSQVQIPDKAYFCQCVNGGLNEEKGKINPLTQYRLRPVYWQTVLSGYNSFFAQQSINSDWTNIEISAMPPVIVRRDGLPAYHIATLADDQDFGITDIIRGEDLLPSSILQLYIAHWLGLNGFLNIRFYHHPLLTKPDGEKLSKTSGKAVRYQFTENEVNRLKESTSKYSFLHNMAGFTVI